MITVQTDILDTAIAEATILENRETCATPRLFTFFNRDAAEDIIYRIQESADGGATWSYITLASALTQTTLVAGEAGAERIISTNILRIRAYSAGGATTKGLELTLLRTYADAGHVWTDPRI